MYQSRNHAASEIARMGDYSLITPAQLEAGQAKKMGESVADSIKTRLRNQLLDNERVLLPALGFEFAIEVPQQFIALAVGERT